MVPYSHGLLPGIIDYQHKVGNKAVNQLLNGVNYPQLAVKSPLSIQTALQYQIYRQALLNASQSASAIDYTDRHYDQMSTEIIQISTGATRGVIVTDETVQKIAEYQQSHAPLEVDGKVGPNTLNAMVPELVGVPHRAIQLVVDFYKLPVERTLTIHHDPAIATDFETHFESGNARVIKVGASALTNADSLRNAIKKGLSVPAPAAPIPGERPTHLDLDAEKEAVAFNKEKYQDVRAVLGIQGLVGTRFDTLFGPDTAERIAEYQSNNGLILSGKADEQTLKQMVSDLDDLDQQNSAIRMIMDFYDMNEFGSLLDIAYDPTETANATTRGPTAGGPSIVRVGPDGFSQGYEGLVHTIAHELEHVRQNTIGNISEAVSEFLGERVEILSVGMLEEDADGVMDDAGRAHEHWTNMTEDEKKANWAAFVEVRDKLRARFDLFTDDEKAAHQATMDAYDAEVEPV